MTVKGRMPWSSNATFLVAVTADDEETPAVYKPMRGERPLWDFLRGLYQREVAAYELSEALGWDLVPATIARDDAPLGVGSLQLFIAADFEQNYFTFHEDPKHRDRLARLCAFDLVANNADRKAGHCLLDADDRIWAIDNALTFNVDPKLRTVIWQFGGEPIPGPILDDLRRFAAAPLPETLTALLDEDEGRMLLRRVRALVKSGTFPEDPGGRSYPWPLV